MTRIYNKDNIFFKIIEGKANAEIIHENDFVLCFKDR